MNKLFLRGPVPMWWIDEAAALPGRALAVGIAIWLQAGLRGRRDALPVNVRRIPGVTRSSAQRGLVALERSRLVSVVRRPGRKTEITLLAAFSSQACLPATGGLEVVSRLGERASLLDGSR